MSMFKKFGTIDYTLDGETKKAANIVRAAILKHINVDKTFVYQKFTIPDGASPESVAEELYEDANLYWVLFVVNGIVDPFTGWPMGQDVLEKWVEAKYGSVNQILYFTDMVSGREVDPLQDKAFRQMIENNEPLPANIHPVTAYEHENNMNIEKSNISVIGRRYINLFVDTFHKAVEGKL